MWTAHYSLPEPGIYEVDVKIDGVVVDASPFELVAKVAEPVDAQELYRTAKIRKTIADISATGDGTSEAVEACEAYFALQPRDELGYEPWDREPYPQGYPVPA